MPRKSTRRFLFLAILLFSAISSGIIAAENTECGQLERDGANCIDRPREIPTLKHYLFHSVRQTTYQFYNKCSGDVRIIINDPDRGSTNDVIGKSSTIYRTCDDEKCAPVRRWKACVSTDASSIVGTNSDEAPAPTSQSSIEPESNGLISKEESSTKVEITFKSIKNYDVVGESIENKSAANHGSCVELCKYRDDCSSYTFDRWNRICILKKEISSLRFDPRAISGFRQGMAIPTAQQGIIPLEKHNKKQFYGQQIGSVQQASPADCYGACFQNNKCLAFTATRDGSSCIFFSRVDGYKLADEIVGGLRREAPSN